MVASEIESFAVRVQDCNMLRFQSSSQGEVQIRMKRETGPEDQEKEKGRRGIGAFVGSVTVHTCPFLLLHVYGYFRGSRPPRAHHVSLSAQIHQITSTRCGVFFSVPLLLFYFKFFFFNFCFWHSNLMRTELRSQLFH